jgi:prepilin peptidase CpaA
MPTLAPPTQFLLVGFVVTAAVFDLLTRRIPNWLNLTALVLGLGLNLFLYKTFGLWQSLSGLGLAFLVYFPLYLVRGVGAGDVKLMAAVGAIVGPRNWLTIFVLGALVGGVLAVALLLTRGRLLRTLRNVGVIVNELLQLRPPYARHEELDISKGVTLPHGASVALGSLLFVLLPRAI